MIYERPREKIRNKGAGALTVAELFQLIIGSGSLKASGAQLAGRIELLVQNKNVTYASVAQLPGMGEAKTCQVLAALELAKRGLS